MLGGTVVNITGPCFDPNERIVCTFDTEHVVGYVVDRNRAICVQPFLLAQGYIRFLISVGNDRYKWRGEYFVGECESVNWCDGDHIKVKFLSFFFYRNTGNGNRTNIFPW